MMKTFEISHHKNVNEDHLSLPCPVFEMPVSFQICEMMPGYRLTVQDSLPGLSLVFSGLEYMGCLSRSCALEVSSRGICLKVSTHALRAGRWPSH